MNDLKAMEKEKKVLADYTTFFVKLTSLGLRVTARRHFIPLSLPYPVMSTTNLCS